MITVTQRLITWGKDEASGHFYMPGSIDPASLIGTKVTINFDWKNVIGKVTEAHADDIGIMITAELPVKPAIGFSSMNEKIMEDYTIYQRINVMEVSIVPDQERS